MKWTYWAGWDFETCISARRHWHLVRWNKTLFFIQTCCKTWRLIEISTRRLSTGNFQRWRPESERFWLKSRLILLWTVCQITFTKTRKICPSCIFLSNRDGWRPATKGVSTQISTKLCILYQTFSIDSEQSFMKGKLCQSKAQTFCTYLKFGHSG